ncbi:MAG: hypothetical protein AAGA65_18785 [Actinomycetota bacterium]
MVAETHTSFEGLRRDDVADFIMNTVAKLDRDPSEAGSVSLATCGFTTVLEVDELAELVGEEYGERTLVGDGFEEIDGSWTVADFVAALYPDLS